MTTIKTKLQGDSLSIGVYFNAEYDTARIQAHYVYLNDVLCTSTMVGDVLRCELKSDDTIKYFGNVKLTIAIDDSNFGIRKTDVGNIYFTQSTGTIHDTSVNIGYDLIVNLVIDEVATSTNIEMLEAFQSITKAGVEAVLIGEISSHTHAYVSNVGLTTLGANVLKMANLTAIRFPRYNADNTITNLSALDYREAIGLKIGTDILAYRTFGTAANSNVGDFDPAGAAASVTPTTLGLVIGVNVLAYRTFGSAANSATTDFVAARTFGTAANNNTGDFLAYNGTAVNSALLENHNAAYFQIAGSYEAAGAAAAAVASHANLTGTSVHGLGGAALRGDTYYIASSLKGSVNGVAELDANGFVKNTQLPSYVDDIIEAANYASLPATGETGKIYVTIDDNKTWRWAGTTYAIISESLALGETESTAYRGDRGKIAYDHAGNTSTAVHGASTLGYNILKITDPSAITFLRANADNTISALSASDYRTAIGLAIGTDVQAQLTFGIANTNAVKIDATDVSLNDYARFTASGLVGRSVSEVLGDIGAASLAGAAGQDFAVKDLTAAGYIKASTRSTLEGYSDNIQLVLSRTFNSVGNVGLGSSSDNYLHLYDMTTFTQPFIIARTGEATFSSTITATTAKLTNLTDGYLPYHVSDAVGLGNSGIWTDGTNVGINYVSTTSKLGIKSLATGEGLDDLFEVRLDANWGIKLQQNWNASGISYDLIQQAGAGSTKTFNVMSFNSGNVAIGYTDPELYRLKVNGTGFFNGALTISGSLSGVTTLTATSYNIGTRQMVSNYSWGGDNTNVWLGGATNSSVTGTAGHEGNFNNAIGVNALLYNTTGYYNNAIGVDALHSNTTGYFNNAIGVSALHSNTTGYFNNAIGVSALLSNTTGYFNNAIGVYALLSNTTGYYNNAIGVDALHFNTTGAYNNAIGVYALFELTEGSNNTVLGYNAGRGITTGSNNTILGASVTGLASTLTDNIILATGQGTIRAQFDATKWTLNSALVISGSLSGVTTLTATSVSCSPTISSGTAAPASIPTKVGDIYVDTANLKIYTATGVTASTDWTILN